jgi:hypothetical protein
VEEQGKKNTSGKGESIGVNEEIVVARRRNGQYGPMTREC